MFFCPDAAGVSCDIVSRNEILFLLSDSDPHFLQGQQSVREFIEAMLWSLSQSQPFGSSVTPVHSVLLLLSDGFFSEVL